MPIGVQQLEDQGTSGVPHPSTPPPPSPMTHTPTPPLPPPPPPPLFSMLNTVKMCVFRGQGSKDPIQFWFTVEFVWKAQHVNDDHLKKEQLVTTLQDRALTWYIRYSTTHIFASLSNTKDTMNVEFRKPKSQAQCVTKIKEIKKRANESA